MSLGHPALVPAATADRPVPGGACGHVTDEPAVCPGCDRTLAWLATRPWRMRCRHCKVDVEALDAAPPRLVGTNRGGS